MQLQMYRIACTRQGTSLVIDFPTKEPIPMPEELQGEFAESVAMKTQNKERLQDLVDRYNTTIKNVKLRHLGEMEAATIDLLYIQNTQGE